MTLVEEGEGEGDVCVCARARVSLHCATWLLMAEMSRNLRRAMSLWKQRRGRDAEMERERCTVCRDGQIFFVEQRTGSQDYVHALLLCFFFPSTFDIVKRN